jgi:hypothetical protein
MHGPMEIAADTSGKGGDFSKKTHIKIYFYGEGVIASGVVIAEEAPTVDHVGDWSPITGLSLTASQASNGAVKVFVFPIQAYAAVRLRATTAVVGTLHAIAEGPDVTW